MAIMGATVLHDDEWIKKQKITTLCGGTCIFANLHKFTCRTSTLNFVEIQDIQTV